MLISRCDAPGRKRRGSYGVPERSACDDSDDFASEYDPMQVSAHKDTTSLFERYAKGGDDPKLKDLAGKTLPALQHHLEMAQDMNKNRK
jgi:predicted outer membrane protein